MTAYKCVCWCFSQIFYLIFVDFVDFVCPLCVSLYHRISSEFSYVYINQICIACAVSIAIEVDLVRISFYYFGSMQRNAWQRERTVCLSHSLHAFHPSSQRCYQILIRYLFELSIKYIDRLSVIWHVNWSNITFIGCVIRGTNKIDIDSNTYVSTCVPKHALFDGESTFKALNFIFGRIFSLVSRIYLKQNVQFIWWFAWNME